MKKFFLFILMVGSMLAVKAQITPTTVVRIPNATSSLGKNIPVGTLVYNIATQKTYVANTGVALAETLTTAAASFTEVGGVTIIDDLNSTSTTEALSAKQGKALNDNKLGNTLGAASIFVGNNLGVAAPVTLSGAATLANDGTLTLQNNTVNSGHLTNSSVTQDKINNGAVNSDKIVNDAVITTKIDNGAVTTDKMATEAVTGVKIAANAITNAKINDGAISPTKLNGLADNGTAGQVLATDGDGTWSYANSLSTNLNSAEIFIGNGGGKAAGVALSGDASLANNGALTVTGIDGLSVDLSTAPTNNQVLKWNATANEWQAADDAFYNSPIDNLTSSSVVDGLAANQGRVLDENKADKNNVLELDNSDAFNPAADYHPATKKYVDEEIADQIPHSILPEGQILIGNTIPGSSPAVNYATAHTLSGDATLANDGTLTIEDGAVDGSDISIAGEMDGDMAYYNGTEWVRLPKGTANQSLVMNSGATAPEWQSGGAAEDVEVVLDEQVIGDGGTLTLPADLSDYAYIRFETDDIINGGNSHAFSETIKTSAIGSKYVLLFDNNTFIAYFTMNATGTVATLNTNFSGSSATCRAVGIKPQKAVVNPADATVIDDDTFATATDSNVPSAESVKALVDDTVQDMVEQVHPTFEIRYIDIGAIRIQWGHLTVSGSASLNIYAMGGATTASSLTASVLADQGITNYYTVNTNIVDYNTITFNVFQNGSATTATIKWMLIGPKP